MSFNKFDRALIIAPHADDESIGCGGFMVMFPQKCDVLILTDGARGAYGGYLELPKDEYVNIRMSETKSAMGSIGVTGVSFLNIPDGKVYCNEKRLIMLDLSQYDYVFVPNRKESHIDHHVVYRQIFLNKMLHFRRFRIIEYEVWTPMDRPNMFLDISSCIEKKIELINSYTSQLEDVDYKKRIMGLNQYRGIVDNVEYAEAYRVNSIVYTVREILSILPERVKEHIRIIISK